MIPLSHILPVLGTVLLSVASFPLHAAIIADYRGDAKFNKPPQGWSYLWNPTGVQLGDSSNYQPLQTYFKGPWAYVVAGDVEFIEPSLGDGQYLRIDKNRGWRSGIGAADSSDGFSHYVIAGYTIQKGEAGDAQITGSSVQRQRDGGSSEVLVYINNEIVGTHSLSSTEPASLDLPLGRLEEGDTVYVAVGHVAKIPSRVMIQYKIEILP